LEDQLNKRLQHIERHQGKPDSKNHEPTCPYSSFFETEESVELLANKKYQPASKA
jgi:hypothetical protein